MPLIATPSPTLLKLRVTLRARILLQTFLHLRKLPQKHGRRTQCSNALRFRHSLSPCAHSRNLGFEISTHVPFEHSPAVLSIIIFETRPAVSSTSRTKVGLQKRSSTITTQRLVRFKIRAHLFQTLVVLLVLQVRQMIQRAMLQTPKLCVQLQRKLPHHRPSIPTLLRSCLTLQTPTLLAATAICSTRHFHYLLMLTSLQFTPPLCRKKLLQLAIRNFTRD